MRRGWPVAGFRCGGFRGGEGSNAMTADHETPPPDMPKRGSIVRLKASAHRYRGGLARVIRHEKRGQKSPRWGMVVAFEAREIWVMPGELDR